ncbi:hypothetical protein GCM10011609_26890 [Lentzea pudingi]|uniref:MacB-like periplasmic core domain-containing protein n=1 Tax=Lentzea pudingi TaxID=1789439 RepID=A0ABQ2HRK6_9PSEU|nr:hypothetical protein [Lentzea pudingi]GGM88732.1 hypothetical protein GCM10011609_26890 [Lentzea pudingi]
MVQVFIQPSYGTPEARRSWTHTLARAVPFRDAGLGSADSARLDALHLSGRARFWGATAKHDRRMDSVTAGDVVLLTGRKHVLAVGEVGHAFRDPAFARHLWRPDPAKCLWSNVYSLRKYWPVRIPYEEIWALPGFNAGDNFMGLRFLAPEKAAVVLAHIAPDLRVPPSGDDETCDVVV